MVARNVWHDNSSDEHVGSPKGGRLRTVPMTQRLRQALLAHRHLRGRRVLCTVDGTGLTPGQLEVALRVLCNRARMRQIGLARAVDTPSARTSPSVVRPSKAIQERMGHSDIVATMRYMHLAPAHHREAIALLEPKQPRSPRAHNARGSRASLWAPSLGTGQGAKS